MQEILDHRDWAELAAEVNYDAVAFAETCGVSVRTLERAFQEKLRITPQRWLDLLRDFEADTLKHAGLRTKEIADWMGYKSSSHLCHKLKDLHLSWLGTQKLAPESRKTA